MVRSLVLRHAHSRSPFPADGGRARRRAAGARRLAVRAEVGRVPRRPREHERRAGALEPERPATAALLPRASSGRQQAASRTLRSTARSSSREKASSTSTRCRLGSTPPRAAFKSWPPRSLPSSSLSTSCSGRASRCTSFRSRTAGASSRRRSKASGCRRARTIWPRRSAGSNGSRPRGWTASSARSSTCPTYPDSRDGVVKVKPHRTADCVIVGFRWSEKVEGKISTLLLGLYNDEGELDFVGHCSGISAPVQRQLQELLPPLVEPGFISAERTPGGQSRWSRGKELDWNPVRPELVCEVRFDKLEKNRFRHGTRLMRFRPDKDPKDCTWREVRAAAAARRPHRRVAPGVKVGDAYGEMMLASLDDHRDPGDRRAGRRDDHGEQVRPGELPRPVREVALTPAPRHALRARPRPRRRRRRRPGSPPPAGERARRGRDRRLAGRGRDVPAARRPRRTRHADRGRGRVARRLRHRGHVRQQPRAARLADERAAPAAAARAHHVGRGTNHRRVSSIPTAPTIRRTWPTTSATGAEDGWAARSASASASTTWRRPGSTTCSSQSRSCTSSSTVRAGSSPHARGRPDVRGRHREGASRPSFSNRLTREAFFRHIPFIRSPTRSIRSRRVNVAPHAPRSPRFRSSPSWQRWRRAAAEGAMGAARRAPRPRTPAPKISST